MSHCQRTSLRKAAAVVVIGPAARLRCWPHVKAGWEQAKCLFSSYRCFLTVKHTLSPFPRLYLCWHTRQRRPKPRNLLNKPMPLPSPAAQSKAARQTGYGAMYTRALAGSHCWEHYKWRLPHIGEPDTSTFPMYESHTPDAVTYLGPSFTLRIIEHPIQW